ncbi:MAG TPA: histidine phosphatase family protein [Gemmatimonadales bacterium]|jgi:broad specificity phosphatase PhoE|nr:histidine phosphatase family protein [Gemmatimonadales bacterium]
MTGLQQLVWLGLLSVLLVPASLPAQTVILVRHAEKAAVPGDDPPLSALGEARAESLGVVLARADVRAVIVTSRQRTRLTAAAVLRARHLTPVVVPLGDGGAAHVRAVAAAVRRQPRRSVVLVVGHSNTIPRIVTALGGPELPDLCDADYSTMFILDLDARPERLVRVQYGEPGSRANCDGPLMRP